MRGAPHFRYSEFAPAGGSLPQHAKPEVRALCIDYLEPLRARFGPVSITSGQRTRERNQAVGGAPQSFHLYKRRRHGVAADVVCRRGTPAEWFALLDDLGAPGLGLYDTHVHVDNRIGRARW
jgi:hypothetical protein